MLLQRSLVVWFLKGTLAALLFVHRHENSTKVCRHLYFDMILDPIPLPLVHVQYFGIPRTTLEMYYVFFFWRTHLKYIDKDKERVQLCCRCYNN